MSQALAEPLCDDPQQLHETIAELQRQVAERDQIIDDLRQSVTEATDELQRLKQQIIEAQRARFGQRSERGAYTDDLFHAQELPTEAGDDSGEAEAGEVAATRARSTGKNGAPRGRKPLPPELPRQTQRHDLSDEQRAELEARNGGALEPIGVEVSETLEYQPGQLYVLRHEVPKYAVADAEGERTIATATRATAPLPGAQAGASLLAHTVVSKFADHLPLNRISNQLKRDGYALSRQRLCDYSLGCGALLAPIAAHIRADALASAVVHSDDTTVAQREAGRCQTRTARLWIYLGRARADEAIAVAFQYNTNRSQEGPLAVLDGYRGYLQADAYSGYLNAERRSDALVWVGCWAHARPRFEKVARRQKKRGRVHAVLKLIRALYQHESRLADAGVCDPHAIAAARQHTSAAILERLQRLLLRMQASLPPRSELGEAVRYALNHWQGLTRFIEDGRLELDNNRAERALRGVCVGRRNWTFVGSPNGGEALAVLLTIIETCKHNGVNPRTYLIDVLRRIQDHPVNRLYELVPYRWTPLSNTGEA